MIEHRLELIFHHVESNTLRMPEDLGVGVAKDPKELKKLKPMWKSSFLPRFGHSDPIRHYSNVSQYFSTYPLYTPHIITKLSLQLLYYYYLFSYHYN